MALQVRVADSWPFLITLFKLSSDLHAQQSSVMLSCQRHHTHLLRARPASLPASRHVMQAEDVAKRPTEGHAWGAGRLHHEAT